MTTVADVGDAIEIIFETVPGATVSMDWLYQEQVVQQGVEVEEDPDNPGEFPTTLLPTSAGMWTAVFTASGTTSQVEPYYVRAERVLGPPPFASVADVGAQFGTMTSAQSGLAKVLVRAGSALLRQRARQAGLDIDAAIADGTLDPVVAALAVTNMALRVLRNPQGLRGETTGPFSRQYDTSAAAGLLVVTADDLEAVTTAPAVADGLAGIGIGTIRVVPGLAPPVRSHRSRYRWGGPHAGQ